jgi:NSS family neurotransmitter:Na+ symporter
MGTTTFSSRLGFILVSAGCAIGLGNVWRFPFITGKYGGASFVVLYLIFLALLGLPIMVAEFAVGRASVHSPAKAFNVLEPKGHVLAQVQIHHDCRQRAPHDVLHDHFGMDVLLLL